MNISYDLASMIKVHMYKVQEISNPNYLTEIFSHPNIVINYLKSEYFSSLWLNIFLSLSGLIIMPLKISQFYECSPFLTFWLFTLGTLNFIILFPKLFVLLKLEQICSEICKSDENRNSTHNYEENNELKMKLWFFVRCNAFLYTQKLTKLIFFTAVLGFLEVWHIKFDDSYLNHLATGIIVVIFTRILMNWKRLEILLQNFKENKVLEKIKSIPTQTMKIDVDSCCSICFEDFQKGEPFQELPCTGKHIFHKECINSWLRKKLSCPNCNSVLFS